VFRLRSSRDRSFFEILVGRIEKEKNTGCDDQPSQRDLAHDTLSMLLR